MIEANAIALGGDFEAHFAALREHLQEVRPIFDEFCARHSFVYASQSSLGRYPRIRIVRPGLYKDDIIELWFDLWMGLDEKGNYFEEFRRDLPYDLGAGAYINVSDDSGHTSRVGIRFACFSGKPFDQVGAVLQGEMQKHLVTLEKWDVQYLKDHGERVQLRRPNER
jgi:hypothetical protein